MRVLEPLTVEVRGLLRQVHDFRSGDRRLARLSRPLWPGRVSVDLADGRRLQVVALGRWRRLWLLWQGETEKAQGQPSWAARRAELVFEAVPYAVLPMATWAHHYRLISEADTQVLTIAFRGPLQREATLCPQVALDLALVVFAYDLARRLL